MKAMLLTKLKMVASVIVVGFAVLASSAAGWQANAAGGSEPQTVSEPARKSPRDPDKERIAQLEEERDKLLKEVRQLRDRLGKIEYAQNLRLAQEQLQLAEGKKRVDMENYLNLLRREDGRTKDPVGVSPQRDPLPRLPVAPPTPAMKPVPAPPTDNRGDYVEELTARVKRLEEERAKGARGTPPTDSLPRVPAIPPTPSLKPVPVTPPTETRGDYLDELKARIKRLEEEKAKAAGEPKRWTSNDEVNKLEGYLRKLEEERAMTDGRVKGNNADRVAELEARVKQMEANVLKLLTEVERLRKK